MSRRLIIFLVAVIPIFILLYGCATGIVNRYLTIMFQSEGPLVHCIFDKIKILFLKETQTFKAY